MFWYFSSNLKKMSFLKNGYFPAKTYPRKKKSVQLELEKNSLKEEVNASYIVY